METVIKGLKVTYEEAGNGPDVLLLHGWGSSNAVYRRMMTELSGEFHLVAPNFPDCGESETLKTAWTTDDYVEFVLEFVEKTGLKNPSLVGHSHGGRVSLKIAGEKKLNPPHIVLLGSAGLIGKKSFKSKLRAKNYKFIKKVLTLPGIKNHTASLLDKARRHYGSADYNNATPVMRQTLVNLVNEDLSNILPNISSPTLLIWGENDTAVTVNTAKKIESLIQNAGLYVINGATHYALCERPDIVNAAVKQFLRS